MNTPSTWNTVVQLRGSSLTPSVQFDHKSIDRLNVVWWFVCPKSRIMDLCTVSSERSKAMQTYSKQQALFGLGLPGYTETKHCMYSKICKCHNRWSQAIQHFRHASVMVCKLQGSNHFNKMPKSCSGWLLIHPRKLTWNAQNDGLEKVTP